jgi:hypothetical protein
MKEFIFPVSEEDYGEDYKWISEHNNGELVRCKDCKNWIPGYITDQDDFIPPKCGKYQQMVGHSADDFCSLAEKQEGR